MLGGFSTKNLTSSSNEGTSTIDSVSLELGEVVLWGGNGSGEGVFAAVIILAVAVAAAE